MNSLGNMMLHYYNCIAHEIQARRQEQETYPDRLEAPSVD